MTHLLVISLRFVTGVSTVPPMGFEDGIKVGFLLDSPDRTLPTAQACFGRLNLPVVHQSSSAFDKAFITALKLWWSVWWLINANGSPLAFSPRLYFKHVKH